MGESKNPPAPQEPAEPKPRMRDPVGQSLIIVGAGLSAIGLAVLMVKLAVMVDWLLAGIIAGLGLVLLIVGVAVR